MSECLYCEKKSGEVEIDNEHVIPQFLGGFEPVNPIIKKEYDFVVCKPCNRMFSGLETIFKEDSHEGLFSQQVNLEGSSSVRLLGKRLKIESVPGFGDSFFNEIFPFLKIQDEKFFVDIKPQFKIRNYAEGYQVFSFEALKIIRQDTSRFKKIRQRMVSIKNEDISIFSGANSLEDNNIDEMIGLLNQYRSAPYIEKKRKFTPTAVNDGTKWEINLQGTIDSDICRVLAKILFNYFAFCAITEGFGYLLFRKEFLKIRKFIKGNPEIKLKDIIVSFNSGPNLGTVEQNSAHFLIFEIKQDKIIGKISVFGINIYEVLVGEIPSILNKTNFGCSHLFDPFKRKIYNCNIVANTPTHNLKSESKPSFGLFKSNVI